MNPASNVLSPGEQVVYRLRELYRRYGYKPYKMSQFEPYDLYAENKSFLVSENVITFTGLDGTLLALKPDVTLSIVKNFKETDARCKVYYNEAVYRADAEGQAFREIMQTGLEYLGDVDLYATGEVCGLAVRSLQAVSDDYLLDFSHMGFLTGVLDAAGLSDAGRAEALTYLGEKNLPGMRAVCAREGVAPKAARALCELATLYAPFEEALPTLRSLSVSDATDAALAEMTALFDLLRQSGDPRKLRVDFSIVNDMNYYSGLIFQGFLEGLPCAILSGGRYDPLLAKFGKQGGAIGFAVYTNLLEQWRLQNDEYDADVLLLYGDADDPADVSRQVQLLAESGQQVLAARSADGARCRRTFRMRNGGAEHVE